MASGSAASLRQTLYARLGRRGGALRAIVQEAVALRTPVFLMCGAVRDLLLDAPIADLDVMVGNRSAQVARRAAARLGGRVTVHREFLTARIDLGTTSIDIAQARTESYARPGALPSVTAGAVEGDLARRDFSINALALPLHRSAGASLLDPYGGVPDLERGALRVLHPMSFRDDPTRLFRAARYLARFRFRLAPATRSALSRAVRDGAVATLSGARIAHELERILDERDSESAARRAQALNLFGSIHAGWALGAPTRAALRRFDRLRRGPPWPEAGDLEVQRACGLRILLLDTKAPGRAACLERLGLRGRPRESVLADLADRVRLERRLARASVGAADAALSGRAEAGLLFLSCAAATAAARRVERFAGETRRLPSPLDGHAAHRLGLHGPEVGAFLRAARRRALDGASIEAPWQRAWLARRRWMG